MSEHTRREAVSWLAAALLLAAYILLSQNAVSANSYLYNALCALGGGLFAWYGVWRCAWAMMAFNALYAVVAVRNILRIAGIF